MATLSTTLSMARSAYVRGAHEVFIYRVGKEWMYTTQSYHTTQASYKRRLQGWRKVERSEVGLPPTD